MDHIVRICFASAACHAAKPVSEEAIKMACNLSNFVVGLLLVLRNILKAVPFALHQPVQQRFSLISYDDVGEQVDARIT